MELEKARSAALALAQRGASMKVAIRDELTIERDFGWVFVWGPSSVGQNFSGERLLGNAPIIVDRISGKARFTGTAYPIEWYVRAYEQIGEQRFDAGEWRDFIAREYARELETD